MKVGQGSGCVGRSIVAHRLSNPMYGHLPAVRSLIAAPSVWGAHRFLLPRAFAQSFKMVPEAAR